MDFVDFCILVLRRLIQEERSSSLSRHAGVNQEALACAIFGGTPPSILPDFNAISSVLEELRSLGFIGKGIADGFWKATLDGREHAKNPMSQWAEVCGTELEPEEVQLVELVNRRSPEQVEQYQTATYFDAQHAAREDLGWTDPQLVWAIASRLEKERGFVKPSPYLSSSIKLRATYRGLVWETRRGLTLESNFIDELVAEWETTSVEFKREVYTKTADEKAELVKDLIGLANTQASGRRWLIIGFDDKTRAYHGPPDRRLTQDHLEQLMTQCTVPNIEIRYEVVKYRQGLVGKLEVKRDPKKLPYTVAKSVGTQQNKKRIELGQVFVRHGSQTEAPTPAELSAIQAEGDRARSFGNR